MGAIKHTPHVRMETFRSMLCRSCSTLRVVWWIRQQSFHMHVTNNTPCAYGQWAMGEGHADLGIWQHRLPSTSRHVFCEGDMADAAMAGPVGLQLGRQSDPGTLSLSWGSSVDGTAGPNHWQLQLLVKAGALLLKPSSIADTGIMLEQITCHPSLLWTVRTNVLRTRLGLSEVADMHRGRHTGLGMVRLGSDCSSLQLLGRGPAF